MSAPVTTVRTGTSAARTARFVLGKASGMIIVLLVVSALTYAVFVLLPADPAQLACGRPCTPERLEAARGYMGLDLPSWKQYLLFLGGIFAGRTFGSGATAIDCAAPCLGYSFRLNESVTDLITSRLPVTFSIAIGAAVLWLVVGVAAGVVAAIKRGTVIDRAVMIGAIAGVSAPSYLVGLLGILLFGFTLNMVPVSGYVAFTESPLDWAWHLVLPWTVLAILMAAVYARLTRAQMLDVMGSDFIRTARAKGLTEQRVITRHALRNVMIPVITLFGLDLGGLLGGAVITEKVFSMPGLGALLLDAVGNFDLPVLVGVTLFSAAVIIVANFLVDLVYGVLDPRARA
ncbi:peptide/nickel transport system permease protein [Sanguibacter gelidistatuariae]|uniref:Peptide/nickel transport system permease protein n=1 Tax=Sanguibacter gelidistatuariae TaxID=1814289 RepID=A0A1G6NC50_9MICO|nr:ABC transporter permease [Sanguibacter gelidistatuariae]SDC65393.1 peptide/nickel transport system permease protein [Sanguibacter gelidistatuariae]